MSLINKPLFRLFLLFLIIYAVFARVDGWPENSRLDLTRAIVDEGRFEIDSYASNTRDRAYFEDHYYTDKFPGASFIAVPPYFIFKHTFGNPSISDTFYPVNPQPLYNFMLWFIILTTSGLLSALTVVLVFKVTGFFTNKRSHQYLAAVSYGIGTMAFNYATLFYSHAISTFFSFLAFYIIYTSVRRNDFSMNNLFLSGLSIGVAIITTPTIFFVFLALASYLLFYKKLSGVLVFSLGVILILLLLFFYNLQIFGGVDLSYNHIDREVFFLKEFMIEDSACMRSFDSFNTFKKLSMRFLPFRFFSKNCEAEISFSYSNASEFPLYEGNSFGESFQFQSRSDETYFFDRNYLVNGQLKTFDYKHSKKNDVWEVYAKERNASNWILSFVVHINESFYHIESYEDGAVIYTNCSAHNKMSHDDFSCSFSSYTFSGTLIKEVNRSYVLSDKNSSSNSTFKKFGFHSENTYMKQVFFINVIKLLFYPYRGLLFYSPILLFSFIGLFFMLKEKKYSEMFVIIFIFVSLLFFQASLIFWSGGTAFGPRHLMPAIPFLFVPLAFSLKKINLKIILFVLAVSFLINLSGMQALEQAGFSYNDQVYFSPESFNYLFSWNNIKNPLFEHYLPLFFSQGPKSMLLEKVFRTVFPPFLNVSVLMLITALLFLRQRRSSQS